MGINGDYIGRSITGVIRLSVLDPKGMQFLDLTTEGFFRSFWAVLLAAPLYVYFVFGQMNAIAAFPESGGKSVSMSVYLILHGLNFLGSALIFLAAMAPVSRFLQVQHRYGVMAIAYNWGTLAIQGAIAVPMLLFGLGLIGAADAISFGLIVVGFSIYFRFANLRLSLETPWPMALALALIDLLMQWVWWMTLTSFV